ncbi:MAG: hypothetical protein ACRENY_02450 [Candidatus Dormibacteria bacterium]
MAGVILVGLALSALAACGSSHLGRLKVSSRVVSTGSSASTTTVPQGTEVDVRITVTNLSQNSIGGVTVTATVPHGFTYLGTASTSTNGNSERSADIAPTTKQSTLTWGSWAMGPSASGSRSQVLITVSLRADGSPATVQLSPTVYATGYSNTLSGTPLALTISPAPTLTLQLHVTPSTVAPGGRVTYQLTVTNTGSGEAPATSIGINLPDSFDYVGPAGSSGNASLSGASTPNVGTEVPNWSGVDLPGAGSGGPGVISLSFIVEVLSDVPAGTYTCTAVLVAGTGSQTQDYIQRDYTALAAVQVAGS